MAELTLWDEDFGVEKYYDFNASNGMYLQAIEELLVRKTRCPKEREKQLAALCAISFAKQNGDAGAVRFGKFGQALGSMYRGFRSGIGDRRKCKEADMKPYLPAGVPVNRRGMSMA